MSIPLQLLSVYMSSLTFSSGETMEELTRGIKHMLCLNSILNLINLKYLWYKFGEGSTISFPWVI